MERKTHTVSSSDCRDLLKEALRLVSGCRKVILRKIDGGFNARLKSDKTYVTDADRAAERYLRRRIARQFPDHGIIGEEFGATKPDAAFQWIIDPIDGTLNFVRGIPLFGTILALHHRGRPILGVVDLPALDDRTWAARGLGAFRNGERIRIRDLGSRDPIESEIITAGYRKLFERSGDKQFFYKLTARHPIVLSYADCFGHALAARGAVGAMVDFGVRLWDIAATQVIIEEAGGKYVCCRTFRKPGGDVLYGIIFGKPKVVDWLLRIFSHDRSRRKS